MSIVFTSWTIIFSILASLNVLKQRPYFPYYLAPSPNITLGKRPPASDEKRAHIQRLIAKLAEVDRPGIGYCQTYGGLDFLPVSGQALGTSWTVTKHNMQSDRTLKELVFYGPDALPFLLEALDNKTATKLTFRHGEPNGIGFEGSMSHSDELEGNPFNAKEAALIDPPNRKLKSGPHLDTYQVKIGDLSFVAIGQIVGRPYLAARYQMTACTVINSPVRDAAFRDRIRRLWASDDPAKTLFDSLVTDYRVSGGGAGSRYQSGAALRLLYYFPENAVPLIAARLNALDVTKTEMGTKEATRQIISNGGIYLDEFIHAVAWCERPPVRKAVRKIFERTTNVEAFAASLDALDEADIAIAVKKGDEMLNGLSAGEISLEARPFILGLLAERTGIASLPIFRRVMSRATADELGESCKALRDARGDWPVPILVPLLDDIRPTSGNYYVRNPNWKGPGPPPSPGVRIDPNDEEDLKSPIRVCDAAAESISTLLAEKQVAFPKKHDRVTLDAFIAKLKSRITEK